MKTVQRKFNFKREELDLTNLEIIGKRIKLCSISKAFVSDIFKEFTSDITQFMFPKPAEKIEETIRFIEIAQENMDKKSDIVCAILKKESDEFLGCCGLHLKENPRAPEFGIWLKKTAHGNKFGNESINVLKEWAIENLDFDYFIYPVDKSNNPSRKIPESLGGIIIKEDKVKTMSNTFLNLIVFKIKK